MRTLERASGGPLALAVTSRRIRTHGLIEALPLAAAIFCLAGFLVAAYFRITFPYTLWVMETPAMQAIRRILAGQQLYAAPTLDYVPPIYAPLYFYLSALVAKVIGVSLIAPRLVSLLASLGSAITIGWLVWNETRRAWLTILAAGLFIATTTLASQTLDMARVDPTCLLLMLGAITTARMAQRDSGRALLLQVASGVLTGLAVLTKQTAIALAAPLVLVALLDRRPLSALAYVGGLVVAVGLGALVLVAQNGDWAQFYLVRLPRQHSLSLDQFGVFWTQKILPGATLLLVLAPVFFIGRALRGEWRVVRFWLLVGLGMLGISWGATLNRWSDSNVLLPAFAVLSILGALGFDEILRRLDATSGAGRAFRLYAVALLVIEFVIIGYNPRESAPLRSDVWGADRFVQTVSGMNGTIFAPDFPEYQYEAGKGDAALGIAVLELTGGFGGKPLPEGSTWIATYRAALDQRKYDALLLDPEGVEPFLTDEAMSAGYVDTGPLFKSNDVFWSWGSHFAPKPHVWLPKERVHPTG